MELIDVEIMMGGREGTRWMREVINRRRDSRGSITKEDNTIQ